MRVLAVLPLLVLGCQGAPPDDPRAPATPSSTGASPTAPAQMELAIPSCAELNDLWLARYHAALHVDWPKAPLDCAPSARSLDRSFAEAALVLDRTRFRLDALPTDTEPPPLDVLGFVSQKYVSLVVDEGATYPATDVENRVLHFYPGIADEDGFSVVGNLIHEARHADGLAYLHVECLDGPNQGVAMCDNGLTERFTEGGPHSIAILYFAWAAARSNWPAEKKKGLRDLSSWLVDQRINATTMQRAAWKERFLGDW
jgi:hypothetical protein